MRITSGLAVVDKVSIKISSEAFSLASEVQGTRTSALVLVDTSDCASRARGVWSSYGLHLHFEQKIII